MMETIKNQTYKNIVTIVHTDDPRDEYVEGDIVINGSAYGPEYGNGTYNLYNNRLLASIPDGPGWFHFIDDDDEYYSDDAIERLVEKSLKDYVNVCRVIRWDGIIFPKKWGEQKTYQTECFLMHTDYKKNGKWWGHKGGDHNYSKQLTKFLPVNWIDNLIICRAQEGKGHGRKLDRGGKKVDYSKSFSHDKKITVLCLVRNRHGNRTERFNQGEIKRMAYEKALYYENQGKVKITYHTTYREKRMPLDIYNL